jgi:type VI secretion system protein ImpE
MTPLELYSAGRLADAVAASTQQVKTHPADVDARYFLAQLLCISGQLDRAEKQLETLSLQSTESPVEIALFRQLIRAEAWRREFYAEGRVPEFLETPPPSHLQRHLQASIALRERKPAEAVVLLQEGLELRPDVKGVCNSEPFDGMIDPNDMTASFFEVLAGNGKYFWVPFEHVELVEFHPLKKPRDLLWRPARMVVSGGREFPVHLPATYVDTYEEQAEEFRLARSTDWRGGDGSPVNGVGQRLFLFGDVDRPILEIETLQIGDPAA